ncbi:hypothetical protein ACFVTY_18510 [Streptomyces sp. NPDC058067]|uniref:hypothetical protein n=1 Tax=Streptomyces sp. NPDC058067 TaxID=3346324 RepID=UPI0036E094E8
MGWTVLYIAFGIVALWLLGEVLLQYKARLRFRLLAFVGFVGVVLGVLIPSVIVIGIGAITFAVGQTYVTLSFRRGFSTGWALGGNPGASKRRKMKEPVRQDPTLEVSDLEYEPQPQAPEPQAEATAVYAPEPLPDDTGQYGVYTPAAAHADPSPDYGYDTYAGYDQQTYGYDGGQQQYAAYSDPYIGTQTYPAQPQYDDAYGTGQQYGDPYAAGGYGTETPPGGVWVPQQRTGDDQHQGYGGELPPEQPYPYEQNGQHGQQGQHGQHGYDGGVGYNEQQQYRY